MSISLTSEILETYEGRDKFLKTLSYAAKLATFFASSQDTLKRCRKFGSKMSECRVILRLLDDIPILHETITYGWGKKEPDKCMRFLKILRNAVDVISSPIEHICWLSEQKLVATDESFWDLLSTRLWIVYIWLSILISFAKLKQIDARLHQQTDSQKATDKARKIETIQEERNNQALTCLRLSLDLSYALSYLPAGHILGYRLKTWQVGLLGTLSSIIGIYQVFKKR